MSGLRELKKAETRSAIGLAAARILLTQGSEAMTIAAVAKEAVVATRTFHNYFDSLDEALLQFIADRAETASMMLESVPEGTSLMDTVEQVAIASIRQDDPAMSLYGLFRVCDAVSSMSAPSDLSRISQSLQPLLQSVRPMVPGSDPYDSLVLLRIAVTVAQTALEAYQRLPETRTPEEGEELVRRAFAVARGISHAPAPKPRSSPRD